MIARTLVIESARAAGLSVAQPVGEGPETLIVYGRASSRGAIWAALPVQVRVVEGPVLPAALLADASPDCLQAVMNWPEEQALYLLSFEELRDWSGRAPAGEIPLQYRASGTRWRAFLVARNSGGRHED